MHEQFGANLVIIIILSLNYVTKKETEIILMNFNDEQHYLYLTSAHKIFSEVIKYKWNGTLSTASVLLTCIY